MDNFKVSFDDSGLKEFQRKAQKIDGEREVPLIELLTDSFIHKYTNFKTLQAMVDASGIKDSEEIGNEHFSKFVSTHTDFGNWDEMLKEAGAEYIKRKLGL